MTRSEPSDSWRQLRERLEGDGGLGDESGEIPMTSPCVVHDCRESAEPGYVLCLTHSGQRPSPEGLHAQRLREDDATYGAGSEAARIVDGLAGFRAATPTTAEAAANLERALGRHDGEGRCAESRERVEPAARAREEPLNEPPASTLPSGVALPVPWYELREAVREPIHELVLDIIRSTKETAVIEDEAVERVCAAALREIGEPDREKMRELEESRDYWAAKASRLGNLAMKYAEHDSSACSVPGCQMPRHEAFAETWWTCRAHAPVEAREKVTERPDPIEKPPYTPPPREPIWPVRVLGYLACLLTVHGWEAAPGAKPIYRRLGRDSHHTFDRLRCTRCGKERP